MFFILALINEQCQNFFDNCSFEFDTKEVI